MNATQEKLAIDGGHPVAKEPFPGPWLGPAEIGDKEIEAVTGVLRSGQVFRYHPGLENSYCEQLEARFREMTGCKYALAVGGGTAALICGLVGIGIGDGDEVLIPGHTYIASASAVLIVGGVPVLVEVDESLNMDPSDIESKITSRTRAILPVHMRGVSCRMEEILEVADNHNLKVVEDVAQACGGTYRGKSLGSFGKVGCFSLQQYKIITAGEGGVIVTDDREVYERAAIRHDSAMCFWRSEDSVVDPFPGENFRMNEMEGALGVVQFDRMEGILARLRSSKKKIVEAISDLPGIQLQEVPDPEGDCSVAVVFFVKDAETCRQIAQALQAEGIPAGSVYDKGIPDRHVFPYWEYVMGRLSSDRHGRPWTSPLHDPAREYHPEMLPRTLDILGRCVIVPLSQTYSDRHVAWIAEAIEKVARAFES